MRFTRFTLTQNGREIWSYPSRDPAVSEAARRAADTYRPVAVIAHAEDGSTREAVFNPDGTNQNIWLIDKGKPLVPAFGQIYLNRGGGAFRCIGQMSSATALYYNQAGGSSNTVARLLMRNFNWPGADEIHLTNDFVPYSFFFREYADGRPVLYGGLILHGQEDMSKAYYGIHT